jgi:transcriptional regulator with XRE-family HTH domain
VSDLGDRLKAARKHFRWSLREAERRSGVPNAHISQLETGTIRNPGTGVLIRLAAAYEIQLAELLALAGHADFGTISENGHLDDYANHELWHVVAYVPRGREGEVCEFLAAHGIEVYRMYQNQLPARD